jgi:lipid-A-disaccharide synthase
MNARTIMLVAGDPSGDAIAADLARALATALPKVRFIGAGGPKMAGAGVEMSFDLTADAVIGLSDVFKKIPRFLRHKWQLTQLAVEQRPETIIHVDFSGFNRRLAHAIRRQASPGWRPKIVQYVSPQVWASRPGRAAKMARDFDLLLCLFPFEKEWYERHTPGFRVECVGHPMFDTHAGRPASTPLEKSGQTPLVVLLPGSRRGELQRHLPVVLGAARWIAAKQPARFKLVAPGEEMAGLARAFIKEGPPEIEIQVCGLHEALSQATLALASTGTVTLECAYFGVPTVAFYRTSLLTYEIARRLVRVQYLAMPNLLSGEALYPEFIQQRATASNLGGAALELLADPARRAEIRTKLTRVISSLGGPGASQRAAAAIVRLTNTAVGGGLSVRPGVPGQMI